WIKVEWEEAGVLGDAQPLFVLRNYTATQLRGLRDDTFRVFLELEGLWRKEFEGSEGTQNFLNAVCNYPELRGVQTNLYKCFLPRAWKVSSPLGVASFLHPEGIFDDPKGGRLRGIAF